MKYHLNVNIFTPSRYEDIKLVTGCFAIVNLKLFLLYFKDTLVPFKRQSHKMMSMKIADLTQNIWRYNPLKEYLFKKILLHSKGHK